MIDDKTRGLLNRPLDASVVATRSQAGQTLSYVEAHYVIRKANEVMGFDGWTRTTTILNMVQAEQKGPKDNWYVGYTAHCEVEAFGITRSGVGFGQGIDSDLGRAHESAIKEAESDAFKRAMMTFGDQFGLALYDKAKAHVSKPVSKEEVERNAGLAMRKGMGMSTEACKAFRDQHPKDWARLALDAESEGVTDHEGLILFAQGATK